MPRGDGGKFVTSVQLGIGFLFALLVIILGLTAYWPAMSGGYVLDDFDLLVRPGQASAAMDVLMERGWMPRVRRPAQLVEVLRDAVAG